MTTDALAIVQHGARDLRQERFSLPDIGRDDALLRVEACGICGSDYEQYDGALPVRFPVIPGHEPVGVIEQIGDEAVRRWGVQKGDRVCVETLIPCGYCPECVQGRYRFCRGARGGLSAYGYRSTEQPPSLWGGYAQYLYLEPHALVHRIDKRIPPEIATLFNPIGAGFRWAVEMPRLKAGETIAVLGPGQRGLGAVIAAREAGAGTIIVTGLGRDEQKLALARQYGADHTVNIEQDDVRRLVRDITGGVGADVVIDVTAYAVDAVTQAIDLARRGGRVVLAGTKGPKPVPDFYSDRVVTKEVTLIGALGVDWPAYDAAVRLIESGKYDLAAMHTHSLPLTDAEHGLELLAGRVPGEDAVHIALMP